MMKAANKLFVSACLFLTLGCGYHFRATGEPVGIRLESLAIPMITSTSSEMGFEADFTKIIREEFISHGRVPLVSESGAQAVLRGRVYDISTDALSFNSQEYVVRGYSTTYEVTSKRRMRIKLDMQLFNARDHKVIWRDQAMEERASFVVDPNPEITRYNQREAVMEIARRLAKRVYLKTMERF